MQEYLRFSATSPFCCKIRICEVYVGVLSCVASACNCCASKCGGNGGQRPVTIKIHRNTSSGNNNDTTFELRDDIAKEVPPRPAAAAAFAGGLVDCIVVAALVTAMLEKNTRLTSPSASIQSIRFAVSVRLN